MRHLLLVVLFLTFSFAYGTPSSPREYRLRMFNTHTLERLDVVYRRGDAYDTKALEKLDWFLRDWRANKVKRYDPRLFDLLTELTAKVGRPGAELHIICGYRSPDSNEYLRSRSSAVGKNSLHIQAKAIDIRLPGLRTSSLRAAALAIGRGGVGYYAGSNFIHVDLGRVRKW
ncbi:MAG: twin-arginine translocation pathway signal protein [Elusimicrobia bacterium CG08_land_8_20_14_0_20_51_18]|nr:MAG: twin-arginine translocation pathway signal protein [Elusimicrobia bacterium CG08_land_8_20_14_0_20_51_18]